MVDALACDDDGESPSSAIPGLLGMRFDGEDGDVGGGGGLKSPSNPGCCEDDEAALSSLSEGSDGGWSMINSKVAAFSE